MKNCSFTRLATIAIEVVYSLSLAKGAAGRESVIYRFNQDYGQAPLSGLLYINGSLYGTTLAGGYGCKQFPEGCGLVFAVTTQGEETIVHSFQHGLSGPLAGLTQVGNAFFGTTSDKGNHRNGAVFKLGAQGRVSVVHSFAGAPADGSSAAADLVNVGGTLYGTTELGGSYNQGTVFSVTPDGVEKIVYSFQGGTDGSSPRSSLIWVDGIFYGTTYAGGGTGCSGSGCGTVFTVSPQGAETVIHAFGSQGDGTGPTAGLTYFNKTFYGTTQSGGMADNGTVFSITPQGEEAVVCAFQGGADGSAPFAALTVAGPALYGTTSGGGTGTCGGEPGCGTVFKIIPFVAKHVIYNFKGGGDGAFPVSALTYANKMLYGATSAGGGAQNAGTLYEVTP